MEDEPITLQEALASMAEGTLPPQKPLGSGQAINALLDQDEHHVPGWELTPTARVVLPLLSQALEAQAKGR
jgi:hypothetical protein